MKAARLGAAMSYPIATDLTAGCIRAVTVDSPASVPPVVRHLVAACASRMDDRTVVAEIQRSSMQNPAAPVRLAWELRLRDAASGIATPLSCAGCVVAGEPFPFYSMKQLLDDLGYQVCCALPHH